MAQDEHIFLASGDACPICSALNGMPVSAGYTAHSNCHCQTIPQDEAESCSYEVIHTDTHRNGTGPNDAIFEFEVEVVCPDGAVVGASGSLDLSSYGVSDAEADRMLFDIDASIEDLAQDICDSCAPKEPFLCC